jgi:uncharacterized protein with NAD-binding domain and iron-sulfur cluster
VTERRRVAILGGGIAGLTAAFELTSTPGWEERFEITVHQLGWRLGGKGASSRNPDEHGRIEEHGLHVWFGCYDHAFRVLRAAYEELDRPPSSPFATIEQAFHPQDETPYFERVDGRWTVWPLWFPPAPDEPGTGGPTPSAWDQLVKLVEAVEHVAEDILHGAASTDAGGPHVPGAAGRPAGRRRGRLRGFFGHLRHPSAIPSHALLHASAGLTRATAASPSRRAGVVLAFLPWLLDRTKGRLLAHLDAHSGDRTTLRRAMIELDLGLTAVRGCLRDGVPSRGWDAIDAEDVRAWFARHGASPEAVWSTPIRALYDLYLAYPNGDREHPELSAGVGVHAVLRLAFDYKGAVVNEMRGGMGEIVIAPLYEVLARRGVRFAFFHRVEGFELSPDGARIARIRVAEQVRVKDGPTGYRPLFEPGGVPCWPPAPFTDQIVDGERLAGVDLESRWSGWRDAGSVVLEDGTDFDVALLAISLDGVEDVGAALTRDRRWQDLFDHMATTQSMSAQLWFDRSLEELGWTQGSVPADAAPEPLDVWGDRTELIPLEDWGRAAPRSLQYVCAAMPGNLARRPPTDHGVPAEADAQVEAITAAWLEDASQAMFPAARTSGGTFDWSLLHDEAGGEARARLGAQYLRANIDPSERYVLSLPGTARYRLDAGETGYDNLVVAGDWTRTSWNVGCIEAAAESGVNAAAAVEAMFPRSASEAGS